MKKLYLDIHNHVDGLTAEAVEGAHARDLETQGKYDVNVLKYWFDEGTGKVFCLIEAPSKEAAIAVHREAHGLLADELIEVREGK
jgi:Nickel responsive protein SCO4226-like